MGARARHAPMWAPMLLVLALAVCVRVFFLPDHDVNLEVRALDNDSPSYFEEAARLADDGQFMVWQWRGGGPDRGKVVATAFRPPLWIVVQAVPYLVTGPDPTAGRLFNIALDASACALLVLVGTRLAGRRAGLLAGLFAAFYPPFIASTRQLMSEPLVMLLIVTLLLACDRYLARPSTGNAIALGGVLGLLGLARTNGLVLAVSIGAWLLWRGRTKLRAAVAQVGLITAAAAIVVVPYVAYASARMGAFVPVTDQSGVILSGDFTDTVADRGFLRWGWWDITPALKVLPNVATETEWDRQTTKIARRWVADHPADTAKILGLRTLRYFDLYWEIEERQATLLTGEQRSLTVGSVVAWWLAAPLALLGLVHVCRKGEFERWMPGVVIFITFMVFGLLFGGASRYRVPSEPFVLLLAATAVARLDLPRWLRTRSAVRIARDAPDPEE